VLRGDFRAVLPAESPDALPEDSPDVLQEDSRDVRREDFQGACPEDFPGAFAQRRRLSSSEPAAQAPQQHMPF
jgi:hypothetical protein